MSWTTPQDVIDAWIGEPAPTDEAKLQIWIDRAERLIRNAIPGIQARLDIPEEDLLENVQSVVGSMVERKFRNPEGTRQVSSTTGPFSEQRTYGGSEPGELALLDSEIALLSGTVSSGQRAFTVDTIPVTSPFSPHYVAPEGVYYWCP
jgi:hypothetical protein